MTDEDSVESVRINNDLNYKDLNENIKTQNSNFDVSKIGNAKLNNEQIWENNLNREKIVNIETLSIDLFNLSKTLNKIPQLNFSITSNQDHKATSWIYEIQDNKSKNLENSWRDVIEKNIKDNL